MYQDPGAQVRGIAIYEGGRCTRLRQVSGTGFRMNDWLSFADFEDD
jgi:hypothetical protein